MSLPLSLPGFYGKTRVAAVYTNGDWDAFQQFRIGEETKRLYPNHQVIEGATWPLALAL